MRSGRYILAGVLAFTAPSGATAADPQVQSPSPPPARFSAAVSVLRRDVSVVDASGRAVPDLDARDFEVTVDGRPRRVVFAQFAAASAAVPSPAASVGSAVNAPSAGGRVVAFLVDLESIRSGSERPLLETAAALVEKLPGPDAVALGPITGRALDLTRDHAQLTFAS
jgi:hypothetical protein